MGFLYPGLASHEGDCLVGKGKGVTLWGPLSLSACPLPPPASGNVNSRPSCRNSFLCGPLGRPVYFALVFKPGGRERPWLSLSIPKPKAAGGADFTGQLPEVVLSAQANGGNCYRARFSGHYLHLWG